MIFATIGNDHRPFIRFNKLVLKIADIYPDELIIYQKGYTKFNHTKENIIDKEFISRQEFVNNLNNSSQVFTHCGAGTLLQLANIKKTPYVLPRLSKFKEHINNHQQETLTQFKNLGLAIEVEYPFNDNFFLNKISFKENVKIHNPNISDKTKNSLIESIKKDVENYLNKN